MLQLNPQVPLASATSARWFATFGLFYGVHLAILFYLLIVGREFFSMNVMSPGWLSVRVARLADRRVRGRRPRC